MSSLRTAPHTMVCTAWGIIEFFFNEELFLADIIIMHVRLSRSKERVDRHSTEDAGSVSPAHG